ncbi:MAG: hypothetical protein K2R93_14465 [Gemmatimonadaceae bacterium]|nr:hypothetical protein [Gemmatimonadaceae bacterium]
MVWVVRRTPAGLWLVDFYTPNNLRISVRTPQNAPTPPVLALMIFAHGAARSGHPRGSRAWCEASGFFWPLEGRTPDDLQQIDAMYDRDVQNLRILTDAFGATVVRRLAGFAEEIFAEY